MRTRTSSRNQAGAALIEFALVLPILLILSLVVIEVGRALLAYGELTKSVRDAARYLSMQTPGTRLNEARNLVVYGNTAGSGSAMVTGLSPANVPDPSWQQAGSVPEITTVTVKVTGYTFQPMIASAFGLTFGPIPFNAISATMRSQP